MTGSEKHGAKSLMTPEHRGKATKNKWRLFRPWWSTWKHIDKGPEGMNSRDLYTRIRSWGRANKKASHILRQKMRA
jgi:hypothetical protein